MTRVPVQPEVLRWALERAGLDHGDLAKGFPRLDQWQRGETLPTLKQVERFAKATRTPFGYFFLPSPPTEEVPIPDYRRMSGRSSGAPSPDLLDTIFACQQRQQWYREFARAAGDEALEFVATARLHDDIRTTADEMRAVLGFDLDERRKSRTWSDALRSLIAQVDAAGILVMCSGVVQNNNRRRLDPEEFRGFALCDDLAPVVFVNGADTRAAQMFTLAHEVAHIWLGQSALSDSQASQAPEQAVESWCNRVAAELLVPLDAIHSEFSAFADLRVETERLARRFKVSTLVILRRIHDVGGISKEELWEKYDAELKRLRAIKKASGGDFYLTLGARASRRFAKSLVVSAMEGQTPFTEAFRLLGLKKMRTFQALGESLGVLD